MEIRVRVWGRHSASERGKLRGEERGGLWGPYPRARRLGVDGIGVGRGWSDRTVATARRKTTP